MKLLDLFSGIGGFHLGLKQSRFKFDWVGFSEIDKYASKQYKRRFANAEELGNITLVQPKKLPTDITILCGGFPCQAFSITGKRQGFNDTRGTLFFEIARILRYFKDIGKPIPYFVLENVKGLLNHDNGRTFATIYGILSNLDYTIECQLLNTKWWLPQNRERIYIVGHLGKPGRSKIFPIGENDERNREIEFSRETTSEEEWYMQNLEDRWRYSLHSSEVLRRLTPIECERLQGFPDGWTKGQSDTQRYKQLGNAVSVPVVKAVGDKIIKLIN
tara:strand:+ start:1235 stop:2056 length:822 start_codon:yes stop_codon:yes gene_type:complete